MKPKDIITALFAVYALLLLPLESFAQTPEGKLGRASAFMWAGQITDAATTFTAIKSGGYVEANPLMPSEAGTVVAVKLGYTAGMHFVLKKVAKRHPKLAKSLAYMVGGAGFIPGFVNVNTTVRGGR